MAATGKNVTVNLRLNEPQQRAFRLLGPRQTVAIPWGRGVGKSWFIRNIVWLLVAQNWGKLRPDALKPLRGIRVVALMDEKTHFKEVHWNALVNELEDEWSFLGAKRNNTTLGINFPDGSTFQVFPATAANSKKARGIRADVVIVDECDDVDVSVFNSVCRPWFSEPWSLKMRLVGGTPRKGRHGLLYHLHKLGQSAEAEDARYHSVHATYLDAPETVDPAEAADAERNSPPSVFAREWLCDFDAAEGLVYGDVFDERFHVREPEPGTVWTEMLVGADAGWEDPGCLLLIGVLGSGQDAICWVLDEFYAQHQDEDFWCAKLSEWMRFYPRAKLYHDPSRPDRVAAFRKRCGARPQSVDNAIDAGVQAVANRFVKKGTEEKQFARLYVHPRCKSTLWELGEYRRKADQQNPDLYLEAIVDKHNHAMDSLRYAIFNRFGPVPPARRSQGSIEARQ